MFFESTDHCFTVPLVHSGHKEIAQIQTKNSKSSAKINNRLQQNQIKLDPVVKEQNTLFSSPLQLRTEAQWSH